MLTQSGCGEVEQISHYSIPKPKAISTPATSRTGGKAGEKSRLLGAIVPRERETWFFKLMGPVDAVSHQIEPFLEFIRTVRFEGGKPAWTVPEGWRERGASGMRFATLEIGSEKSPLEITVTRLESDPAKPKEGLLANVNRWRGQLQLAPISEADLEAETTPLPVDGGTAIIVNFSGQASAAGGMGPMGAGGAVGPFAGRRPQPAQPAAEPEAQGDLKYDPPAGWKPVQRGSMSVATFELENDGNKGEITVTPLGAAAGDSLDNVNRWRGQVKLPAIGADELQKELKPIQAGPLTGEYVEVVGKGKDGQAETILGVIVKAGNTVWFVKLRGAADLATREKTHFEEFVHSLRFPTK